VHHEVIFNKGTVVYILHPFCNKKCP